MTINLFKSSQIFPENRKTSWIPLSTLPQYLNKYLTPVDLFLFSLVFVW